MHQFYNEAYRADEPLTLASLFSNLFLHYYPDVNVLGGKGEQISWLTVFYNVIYNRAAKQGINVHPLNTEVVFIILFRLTVISVKGLTGDGESIGYHG